MKSFIHKNLRIRSEIGSWKGFTLIVPALMLFLLSSCEKAVTGCTDPNSLSYEVDAEEDNTGKADCKYSSAIFFYLKDTSTVPVDTIRVGVDSLRLPFVLYVDGEYKTTIEKACVIAPQACDKSIPNAYVHQLGDGLEHTWTAIGKDSLYVYSGKLKAQSAAACIQVPIR